MTQVWDNSKAEGAALLLLLTIADHCHDDGTGAWPSVKRLSAKTRQTERNTQFLLRKLEELGELDVKHGAGPMGVNIYTVTVGGEKISPGGEKISPGGEKQRRKHTPDFTWGVKNSVENIRQISPDPSGTVLEPSGTILSGKPDGGGVPSAPKAPREKTYHKDARTVLHLLNETCGRQFREVDANLSVISQRLREPDVTLEGVGLMIARQCQRWLNTSQAEYLRPETLFGKTKFDGYYAAREQPVILSDNPKTAADQQAKVDFVKALFK